jgi:hypothetical protein
LKRQGCSRRVAEFTGRRCRKEAVDAINRQVGGEPMSETELAPRVTSDASPSVPSDAPSAGARQRGAPYLDDVQLDRAASALQVSRQTTGDGNGRAVHAARLKVVGWHLFRFTALAECRIRNRFESRAYHVVKRGFVYRWRVATAAGPDDELNAASETTRWKRTAAATTRGMRR